MNSFIFRDILAKDLNKVSEIEKICFTDPWPIPQFLSIIWEGYLFWGAFDDDTMAGYLIAIPYDNGLHLANIAVNPRYQRCGLGRKFLSKLYQVARRNKRQYVTLEVRCSNESAIAFYISEGFKQMGIQQGYYNGNEDALLFEKELSNVRVVQATTASGQNI